jgi:cell division protein ZapB
MKDNLLLRVENHLDELIDLCAKLSRENELLRAREESWQQERARLVEKNDIARTRVEAMIVRLKSLAAES